MPDGAGESAEAAPVVPTKFEPEEGSLLRELVGDREALREVEMGGGSGSELESSLVDTQEEEEDTGRPKFRRAAPGEAGMQSMQKFFRRDMATATP